jgi:hypothetical protein
MQGARHRHAPFLMPDGRSLASVLASEARDGGADAFVRRGRAVRASHGARALERRWRQQAAAAEASAPAAASTSDHHDSLAADLDLGRLGRAKARRALNERILRVLAGPLTWSTIRGLYLPAPFGGGGPPPALSRVLPGEDGADVWEPFRSVDPDRQARALAAWEAHVRAGRRAGGGGAPPHPPADAEAAAAAAASAGLRAWAGVCPRARDSLKRAGPARVDAVEAPLLLWLAHHQAGGGEGRAGGGGEDASSSVTPPAPSLHLPAPDAWGRALIHGLAQFHGGLRVRREGEDGLCVRLPAEGGGEVGGGADASAAAAAAGPPARDEEGGGGDGACTEPDTPRSSILPPSAVPPASCGDVLAAFAAARAGGPGATPGGCLRDLLLEHAAAGGAA